MGPRGDMGIPGLFACCSAPRLISWQAHKDLEAWQDLMDNQDREARR